MEVLLFLLCLVLLLAPLFVRVWGDSLFGKVMGMGNYPGPGGGVHYDRAKRQAGLKISPQTPTDVPVVSAFDVEAVEARIEARIEGRVGRELTGQVGTILDADPEHSVAVIRQWMANGNH